MKLTRLPLFHPRNLAGLLVLVVTLIVARDLFFPMGLQREEQPTEVIITPGRNLDHIAAELRDHGLIKSTFSFFATGPSDWCRSGS